MKNSKKKILVFGEILWDIIKEEEHLGGAPLNLAAHLSLLNASSYLVSSVGEDNLGNRAINKINKLGINSDFIKKDSEHKTGIVNVTLKDNGDADYEICRDVAYDFIKLTEEQYEKLSLIKFDCFCFGSLAQRNEISKNTLNKILERIKIKEVFYDINLRQDYYSKELIINCFNKSTIIKLNDEELDVVSLLLFGKKLIEKEITRKIISDYKIKIVIVTHGAKGCAIYSKDEYVKVPGEKVEVIDTVGSGDSFSAAFLANFLETNDIKKSALIANKIGAKTASHKGAIPAL